MKKLFTLALMLVFGWNVYAQQDVATLIKKDLRSEKEQLIREYMDLTPSQEAVFWPLYNDYQAELEGIMDERIGLLQKYADNYDSMSNDMARDITTRSLDLDTQLSKVRKKYYKRFNKVLPSTSASRFYQLDKMIRVLVETGAYSEIPLME
ncbi:hypothetical protein [Pontibacter sp. G13]|uniref:hypothetical protein n=1 Tax=Pontibacter sp. G13 TaxID=3074898 RepID=UPI00288A8D37|nr:hypothetical protein [Pontibacter sp. G13]WNJ17303.1 hypothetical protein RJD25_20835 [Pontibacter sp. G13]